jgi:hypothetical protein
MQNFAIQSGEAVVMVLVGLGMTGYAAFRCARLAARTARSRFREFTG